MNPLKWQREHQIALLVGFAIGAVFGVLIGYVMHALYYGSSASSFGRWVQQPIHYSGATWGLFGGIVGAAIIYAARLLRR